MSALFSIPDSWVWTTLGEIADVVGGVTKDSKKQSDPRLPQVPYLRVANVQRGYLDLSEITKIRVPESTVTKLCLKPGDVLLNEGGDRDKLGRGWIWQGQIPNCIHQNHVFRARLAETLHPKLLAWYANGVARDWFEQNASQSVNLASISLSTIKQLPVPLPPSNEQRRIVAILEDHLSNLDTATRIISSSGQRTKRLWQSVLNSVAVGNSADEASKIKFKSIAEVAQVQSGIQKQQKRRPIQNAFPFLRVANVSRGALDLSEIHRIELFEGEIERYHLEDGDLLVVEGNGSPEQIGRAARWRNEIPDCVHQNHLIRVRPGPELDSRYLEYVWNAPETAQKLRSVASSTSGLFTLNTTKVKSIEIPVPPRLTQEVLVAETQGLRTHLDAAEQSIKDGSRRADSLRRSLLAEAFAGRLVEQDPADEPASVLLERIGAERAAQGQVRRARRSKGGAALEEETLL
jgi:type I restriction enzyme S subunit